MRGFEQVVLGVTQYELNVRYTWGMASPSTWFITGASRGLGNALARHALQRGEYVVAASRSGNVGIEGAASHRLHQVALDVTDEKSITAAVSSAHERLGAIDILVNNAGLGLVGAVEETSQPEVRAVFETNVFGMLSVTRAVLPDMRERRAGHVVNIGSMGGFAQVAGWGVYGATKFALEGLSEAMAAELNPLGIHVMIVEPGGFRTGFLSSVHASSMEIPDYIDTAGAVRRAVLAGEARQANDPARGAAALFEAVVATAPPTRLQLGADAVAMVETKLDRVREELERWRPVACSTAVGAGGSS